MKEKLVAADSTARRCAEMEAERNRLTASAVTVEKEYRQLKELTDRENDIRQAEKLERFLKTKADLETFNEGLLLSDGKLADTVFLSKINFCLAKFDKEQQQVTDRQTAVDDLQKDIAYREKAKTSLTPEGIEQMQDEKKRLEESRLTAEQEHTAAVNELETAEQQKAQGNVPKKTFHPLLLALGAVFIAVGIALFFMKLAVLGIAVGAVGLIGVILSFVLRPTDTAAQLKIEQDIVHKREKVADTKTALGELQEEINRITAEIDRAESVLHSDESALNQRKKDLSEAELRLKEAVFSRDTSLSELCRQFGLYRETDSFEEIKNLLPELQQKIEQQKELKMQLKYMSDDLGGISYEAAAERLEKSKTATVCADTDFAAAKKRLDELTELKSAMATKYATLESELKNELKYAVMPDVIEQEIAELEERLKRQKQFIDAVTIAEKVLENSYAEVRRGYGSALESKTQEIFAQLTGGRYQNVRVSKSMDVDAESTDAFGTHNVAYFSNGTIDQAYLSLRLAVAEGMDGDERLPLFLDDVLCQYDDKRTALALQYLKDYAANTQIILFTCHKSVCEEANSSGVAVKELR
ncbi:MAG: hypothetical protein MJ132_02425 [Clostridia bacterium]|nr:hypothetical protein [Clostridia bacterium]